MIFQFAMLVYQRVFISRSQLGTVGGPTVDISHSVHESQDEDRDLARALELSRMEAQKRPGLG